MGWVKEAVTGWCRVGRSGAEGGGAMVRRAQTATARSRFTSLIRIQSKLSQALPQFTSASLERYALHVLSQQPPQRIPLWQ